MITLMKVLTRGDEMTQPGGIMIRHRPSTGEFIVHNFNTASETTIEPFQGTYCNKLSDAVEEFNRRVQRAAGYDTGGSIDEAATVAVAAAIGAKL